MKRHWYVILLTTGMLLPAQFNYAEEADSARMHTLEEVIIRENTSYKELRKTSPEQSIDKKSMSRMNALQLSDAVKYFAGAIVKDYGGIGGIKTVSLRSLGAEHTAVVYDGIGISDGQTGQIDIGRFSLENVQKVSLTNGQSDDIFRPARTFASAGILEIQTLHPVFATNSGTNITASFKTGAWKLINPSLYLEQKITEKWALSLYSEWMSSDGDYPYTLHYGNQNDSTTREKRNNSGVKIFRAEAGLSGKFSENDRWKTKVYYYSSSRGLPGATTLYNPYSNQHLWDKNIFVQSQYNKRLSRQWSVSGAAKWNWSYQHYLDPEYKNEQGKLDNRYYQKEYYLSAAILYEPFSNLSLSFSNDGFINTLDANLVNFAYPSRSSWLSALAAKFGNKNITATTSLLSTQVYEKSDYGNFRGNHHRLSPYASLSIHPFPEEMFYIRAFYKNIFRLPTFNDLYYTNTGNTDLRPENTYQYNVGITYGRQINSFVSSVSATVDAYYNKVKDKIIAYPTKNIFIWSMVNLGEVAIHGIDATATVRLKATDNIHLDLSGNYTYQRALDVTDPTNHTYKHQIAYTPRVYGTFCAGIESPWIYFSYNLVHSGKRYTLGQNSTDNRIEAYSDHNVTLSKPFFIKKTKLDIQAEVLNILDKNYEIVRYFPMPGRSVRVTLKMHY